MKIGNVIYSITNQTVHMTNDSREYLISVELTAKTSDCLANLRQIYISFTTTAPKINSVVQNVPIKFCASKTFEGYGTVEILEDGYINCYGTVEIPGFFISKVVDFQFTVNYKELDVEQQEILNDFDDDLFIIQGETSIHYPKDL